MDGERGPWSSVSRPRSTGDRIYGRWGIKYERTVVHGGRLCSSPPSVSVCCGRHDLGGLDMLCILHPRVDLIQTTALVCAAGGYGLSGLFAKAAPPKDTSNVEKSETEEYMSEDVEGAKPWPFELQPITANLNEPGATRMIQVTVVMELSAEMDETKGREFLEGKVIHLRDWLQTYLAGLNLEQELDLQ